MAEEIKKDKEPIDVGFKALFVMDKNRIPVEIKSTSAFENGEEAFHLKNSNAKIRFVRVMQFAEQQGAVLSNVPAPIARFMKSTELRLDELYLRKPTTAEKTKGQDATKFKIAITLDFAAGVLTETAKVDTDGKWTVTLDLFDDLTKPFTVVGVSEKQKKLDDCTITIVKLEAEEGSADKLTGNVLLELKPAPVLDPAPANAEKAEIALSSSGSEKTALIATQTKDLTKWSAPVRIVKEEDGLCFGAGPIPKEFKPDVTYFAKDASATIDKKTGQGTLTFKLAAKPKGDAIAPAAALTGVTLKPAAAGLLTSLTGFDMTGLLDIQELSVVVSRGVDIEPVKPEEAAEKPKEGDSTAV